METVYEQPELKDHFFREVQLQGITHGYIKFNKIRKRFPQLDFEVAEILPLIEVLIEVFEAVRKERRKQSVSFFFFGAQTF